MRGKLCKRVRQCLLDASSTAEELSLVLRMDMRRCRVALWTLQDVGHVEASRRIPTDEGPRKLYALTPRGMFFARYEKHRRRGMRFRLSS